VDLPVQPICTFACVLWWLDIDHVSECHYICHLVCSFHNQDGHTVVSSLADTQSMLLADTQSMLELFDTQSGSFIVQFNDTQSDTQSQFNDT
jgi:hypothetical protein